MVRKTKAEAEQTREALLDAAETIFFEKGVARTTLGEIACAAGLTRGALYWHFRNKAEVVKALIDRVELPIDRFLTEIAEARPEERNLLPRMRDLFKQVYSDLAESEKHQKVFTILIQGTELVGEMQPLQDHFDAKDRAFSSALCRVLERCRRNGELAPAAEPVIVANAIHAFFIGILMLVLRNHVDVRLCLSRDAPAMIDLFFAGLARGSDMGTPT